MNKVFKSVSDCYKVYIDTSFHPIVGIFICAFFVIIGLAIGFGIHYLLSWCFMYVYNILAQSFNWPIFSIWFWFIGLYVVRWLRNIIFLNDTNEEE